MAGNIRKAFWVVAVLWLITARDCCITYVGQTVQSSLDWMKGVNPSAEARRAGPVCSCTLLTEPCSLYVLHDLPEPYCSLYTRYCCDLDLLAAILPAANQSQLNNTNSPPVAPARSSKAQRALESCGCTNYLLPCPVHIYENTLVLSGWFECQYFHRYCCGVGVLRDVLLPYVASPEHQQQEGTAAAGKDEQQGPRGEPLRDAAAEGLSWEDLIAFPNTQIWCNEARGASVGSDGGGPADDPPPTQAMSHCEKPCTKELFPICGNDRVTYQNRCLFQIAQCYNPRLSVNSFGRCNKRG